MAILLCSTTAFSQDDIDYPMGISEDEEELLEAMVQKATLTRSLYEDANLPESVSLKPYAPYPGSQSNYGTCTAWAVAYAARTILEARSREWTDRNEITENAFTPAFTYRRIEPDNADCWGSAPPSAVYSLKTDGALPLKYWKDPDPERAFHCPDSIESRYLEMAKEYTIEDYARLFKDLDKAGEKTSRVKLSLSNGNPVVISMKCPKSFMRESKPYWTPTDTDEYGEHGRHAMTVVGYDNDLYGGAFEIQNSWSQAWNEDGYIWVRYEDFNTYVYGAIELAKLPEPEPEIPLFAGGMSIYRSNDNTDLTAQWNQDIQAYEVGQTITEGDELRFYLQNQQPAYVYLLGSGSVNTRVAQLFPFPGESALLNYQQNVVPVPNEDTLLIADGTIGEDYLMMLFSREALDIEAMVEALNSHTGSFSERVGSYLGARLIDPASINNDPNSINFETYEDDPSKVMALMIAFDHK